MTSLEGKGRKGGKKGTEGKRGKGKEGGRVVMGRIISWHSFFSCGVCARVVVNLGKDTLGVHGLRDHPWSK